MERGLHTSEVIVLAVVVVLAVLHATVLPRFPPEFYYVAITYIVSRTVRKVLSSGRRP